jgi:hypothetical protein
MRGILTLVVALGMSALLGSITLVHADCAYHKAQAAVERSKTSKQATTATSVDKTAAGQLQTAQSDKSGTSASQTKN